MTRTTIINKETRNGKHTGEHQVKAGKATTITADIGNTDWTLPSLTCILRIFTIDNRGNKNLIAEGSSDSGPCTFKNQPLTKGALPSFSFYRDKNEKLEIEIELSKSADCGCYVDEAD